MKKKEIIISMQTAFLGAICNKVRLIAFDMTEELFTLYVYIDSPLTDDEYEAIDSAVTDVLADFPNFLYEKIYIIENNDDILSLNIYKGCFFMRFENQMSDKQKNENALHLNTLLLSSIENPSIDNDCFIELFSYYSNISQGEVSELFYLLQSLAKDEINIIYDFLEYISKFVKDLGVYCEFEKFLTEVKYIQERNYLEEKIRPTFPVFKVDKNNIISFDDSDNSYIFSIMQLSTKTWIEITYDDFLSILESLEWQAFTNKALLYFTPCCLKYIFSNLSKFHLYGYVVEFLYIALRNQSTIFNTTQIKLIIDFLKLIQNFNQEISVETQKKITSTIQLYS